MKKIIIVLTTIIFLFIGFDTAASSKDKGPGKKSKKEKSMVELQKVLKNIHQAFVDAIDSATYKGDENVLNFLSEVSLKFEETVTTEGTGGVKLFIKIGGKRSKEKSKSISYSFVPLAQAVAPDEDVTKKIYKNLLKELLNMENCLEEYKKLPYRLTTLELEFGISIETSGEAGVEFTILSKGVELGGSRGKSKGNTITLKFEFPEKKTVATKP